MSGTKVCRRCGREKAARHFLAPGRVPRVREDLRRLGHGGLRRRPCGRGYRLTNMGSLDIRTEAQVRDLALRAWE